MVIETKKTDTIEKLLQGWQDTLVWSCLQGVMGHLYTTSDEQPVSAMALLGDFTFFSGKPDKELVLFKPEWSKQDFMIMVPPTEEWASLIEQSYGEKAKRVTRYAIKKEPLSVFDREKLKGIVEGLPAEYDLRMMDEELFARCREIPWCKDWVAHFENYDMYQKWGLGAVILRNDEIVSGASSYSGYQGGIEIEIITNESYRRKGLAGVCGAKLVLECLERGWYPSWDAQNLWSAALAEKLGYHFDREYAAYEIWGY